MNLGVLEFEDREQHEYHNLRAGYYPGYYFWRRFAFPDTIQENHRQPQGVESEIARPAKWIVLNVRRFRDDVGSVRQG